jgi:pimeloyl-ACP methyl ester carboxylesterase
MSLRLLTVAAAIAASFACSSAPADEAAADALLSDDLVTVELRDDLIGFLPAEPATDVALVFYPGALVHEDAYAPLMREIALRGIASVIVPMPSDFAVLAPNKGDDASDAFPELGPWVASGHSLGGAMAATWADRRRDDLAGLALFASYPGAGRDLSDVSFPVLSALGSEDGLVDRELWEERKALLPADTTYAVLEGGNHAGFGSYGAQDGDNAATLPQAEQWSLTADLVAALVLGPPTL